MSTHVAIDIGGSRGRGTLAVLEGGAVSYHTLGSFSTAPVVIDGLPRWNLTGMLKGIRGLVERAARIAPRIDTVGIDSMGLAFALLDGERQLVCPPLYTRTPQREELKDAVFSDLGREGLFRVNGLEQQKLNTLYYLKLLQQTDPQLLKRTRHFMMLPDLLGCYMTGRIGSEYTIATTSGLINAETGRWDGELVQYAGLSRDAMPEIVQCGDALGYITSSFCGLPALKASVVVHTAEHDTASALYAIKDQLCRSAFISAGTWGMIGCLLERPILSPEALELGFANEGAANGKIKFIHNAPCMSVFNGCHAEFRRDNPGLTIQLFLDAVEEADGFPAVIDLYHPSFRAPEGMARSVREYCRDTGQPVPQTAGEIGAVVLGSIAENFGSAFRNLQRVTGMRFEKVLVVGGAGKSPYFLRKLGQAISAEIVPGPEEASTVGNVLAQIKGRE